MGRNKKRQLAISADSHEIQLYLDTETEFQRCAALAQQSTSTDTDKPKTKKTDAKYKDLPVGLTESRGCRRKYYTRKGNPIGRIMCQLRSRKFVSVCYGDTRSRKEAIQMVAQARQEDLAENTKKPL